MYLTNVIVCIINDYVHTTIIFIFIWDKLYGIFDIDSSKCIHDIMIWHGLHLKVKYFLIQPNIIINSINNILKFMWIEYKHFCSLNKIVWTAKFNFFRVDICTFEIWYKMNWILYVICMNSWMILLLFEREMHKLYCISKCKWTW